MIFANWFRRRKRFDTFDWHMQDARHLGGSRMSYCRGYEIYWSDDCDRFLLTFPHQKPAELYQSPEAAQKAAEADHAERTRA